MRDRDPKPTVGSQALAARFTKHGDMGALATRLEVDPALMSRWASGRRVPRMEKLLVLEEVLGIPVRDWAVPAPAEEPLDRRSEDPTLPDAPDRFDTLQDPSDKLPDANPSQPGVA